jgi:hypothetical protein
MQLPSTFSMSFIHGHKWTRKSECRWNPKRSEWKNLESITKSHERNCTVRLSRYSDRSNRLMAKSFVVVNCKRRMLKQNIKTYYFAHKLQKPTDINQLVTTTTANKNNLKLFFIIFFAIIASVTDDGYGESSYSEYDVTSNTYEKYDYHVLFNKGDPNIPDTERCTEDQVLQDPAGRVILHRDSSQPAHHRRGSP